MLIVGSVALQKYKPDIKPRDVDIIGTFDECQELAKSGEYKVSYPLGGDKWFLKSEDGKITEFEIAYKGSSGYDLLEMLGVVEGQTSYADLDTLYMLKESHKYLKNSPHFSKTMKDIWMMRSMGAKFKDGFQDWFREREKETYNYSLPKLNQGKNTFFNEEEDFYKYDHDDIHEAVAVGDRPAYLKYKPENEEVWCDKGLFDSCTEEDKLLGVYEESLVLTLERWLVPNDFKLDPYDGFKVALMKVCTSITSGWFREYAWENYYKVLDMYNEVFVEKFHCALSSGEIGDFKGGY